MSRGRAVGASLIRQRWRMRMVVGIGVSADSLRAVGVKRGKARWCVDIERAPGAALSDEVHRLLQSTRAFRHHPRPLIALAVPPTHSQVKNLTQLPPAGDRVLEAVVRESAGRFFRKNGVPLAIGGVHRVMNGVWATAYELPFLKDVAEGCARVGARLHSAYPSTIAAARSSPESRVHWREHGEEYEVLKSTDGSLLRVSLSARRDGSESGHKPRMLVGLESLGADAWRFADAYGAANCALLDRLAIRPVVEGAVRRKRNRMTVAATACLVAWTVAVATRVATLRKHASEARIELARLSPARQAYGTAVSEVARATHQLEALAGFDAQRGRVTTMLSEVAASLPPGAAITALHVDTAGGTMAAIAPQASSLVEALEHVHSIASIEILGPIGREVLTANEQTSNGSAALSSQEVERVTLRFKLVQRRKGI